MATYFNSGITKRQVGVIFSKAKAGELKVEKWVMANFYAIADAEDIDWNGSMASTESLVKEVLNALFAGAIQEAQIIIDNYTENTWALMGKKGRARANRAIVA